MGVKRHINNINDSWPWWRLIMAGLNMLALALSIVLSWHYFTGGSIAGCSGESSCARILNSRWSVVAGIIPVSGLAAGVYLAMLTANFFIGPGNETPVRRMAWGAMLILSGSVTGSAIWFIILQKWIIRDFCPWCMTVHITGLLLSAIIIWQSVRVTGENSRNVPLKTNENDERASLTGTGRILRPLHVAGLVLTGLLFSGLMAAGQTILNSNVKVSQGVSDDSIPAIDYRTVPIVGSPDARNIVFLLFDYQCSHCQRIHFMLDMAVSRYSGNLAFVLCPVPLDPRCNPYIPRDADEFRNSCDLARISLAVWLADRNAFSAFEDWMYTFESGDRWHPRSPEDARAKAIELTGKERFYTALSDPWINKYMETCIRIYGQTLQDGRGGIPRLVFGSRWAIPEVYDAGELLLTIQKNLGVPAP